MSRQDLQIFLGAIAQGAQIYQQGKRTQLAEREMDQSEQRSQANVELQRRQQALQVAEALGGLGKIPDQKARVATADMLAGQLGFDVNSPMWKQYRTALTSQDQSTAQVAITAATHLGLEAGDMAAIGKFAQENPTGALNFVLKYGEAQASLAASKSQQTAREEATRIDQARLGLENRRLGLQERQFGQSVREFEAGQQSGPDIMKGATKIEGQWADARGNPVQPFVSRTGQPFVVNLSDGSVSAIGTEAGGVPRQAGGLAPSPTAGAAPGAGGPQRVEKLTEAQAKVPLNVGEAAHGLASMMSLFNSPEGKAWADSARATADKLIQKGPTVGGAVGTGVGSAAGLALGSLKGHPLLGAGIGGSAGGAVGTAIGSAPDFLMSDEGKRYYSSANAILEGLGFQQSGAARGGREEREAAMAALIPAPWDPPQLQAEKVQRIQLMIKLSQEGLHGTPALRRMNEMLGGTVEVPTTNFYAGGGEQAAPAAAPQVSPPMAQGAPAGAAQQDITQEGYMTLPKGATYWWQGKQYQKQ